MKNQIFGVTIAVSTVLLIAFPGATSTKNKVEYQAVKLENSIDAMLDPRQGGIIPMPLPPPWIPPIQEEMTNQMPSRPQTGNRNYTPMRHLPPSAPWIIPNIENDSQLPNGHYFPIR